MLLYVEQLLIYFYLKLLLTIINENISMIFIKHLYTDLKNIKILVMSYLIKI